MVKKLMYMYDSFNLDGYVFRICQSSCANFSGAIFVPVKFVKLQCMLQDKEK